MKGRLNGVINSLSGIIVTDISSFIMANSVRSIAMQKGTIAALFPINKEFDLL